mmetsp:Transcript_61828/g.166796  ORF Transcript_61828/g.166796 Transcript_61828/m.166796 type:complete len:230 (+) Transcript_61828:636-1325(+)
MRRGSDAKSISGNRLRTSRSPLGSFAKSTLASRTRRSSALASSSCMASSCRLTRWFPFTSSLLAASTPVPHWCMRCARMASRQLASSCFSAGASVLPSMAFTLAITLVEHALLITDVAANDCVFPTAGAALFWLPGSTMLPSSSRTSFTRPWISVCERFRGGPFFSNVTFAALLDDDDRAPVAGVRSSSMASSRSAAPGLARAGSRTPCCRAGPASAVAAPSLPPTRGK